MRREDIAILSDVRGALWLVSRGAGSAGNCVIGPLAAGSTQLFDAAACCCPVLAILRTDSMSAAKRSFSLVAARRRNRRLPISGQSFGEWIMEGSSGVKAKGQKAKNEAMEYFCY
jgi:hypothetical protein